ncbi:hypothetical protein N7519_005942 [Penicillium mononematosum]|uniref:uncharacterized protein n=1 Tax=Penicillium mononematosum TaxID=268346 RepID=UPI0025472213|nr:uncharacterized protein N7519_005942 [Penicillium mononematosum]KAJ6184641.1 hypothetical protein N7519_005942 [Penicillium mononematosum]
MRAEKARPKYLHVKSKASTCPGGRYVQNQSTEKIQIPKYESKLSGFALSMHLTCENNNRIKDNPASPSTSPRGIPWAHEQEKRSFALALAPCKSHLNKDVYRWRCVVDLDEPPRRGSTVC